MYSVWRGVKDRCTNLNLEHYDRYGGRGIKMCDEWLYSFESFAAWAYSAGYDDKLTGKEQSIERINVNGNYEPSNCKWVTQKEQMRNTSRTVWVDDGGVKVPLSEFCEQHNITYPHFVIRHIEKGFSTQELVRIWEFRQGNHEGYYSMKEASEHYGVGEQSIKNWIDAKKLNAVKVGNSWYIPHGQEISRRSDRDNFGRFLPKELGDKAS